MRDRECKVIDGPHDDGRWFDRNGNRYKLNDQTWCDLHRVPSFGGLLVRASDPRSKESNHGIWLRLPYEKMRLYDQFAHMESSVHTPGLKKWTDIRRTFVEACKQALFYGGVSDEDEPVVEPTENADKMLALHWRTADDDGMQSASPLVFDRSESWETDLVAGTAMLVLRSLRSGEIAGLTVNEIGDATYAPMDAIRRAVAHLTEAGSVREEADSAAEGLRYAITVAGKNLLEHSDNDGAKPRRIGF